MVRPPRRLGRHRRPFREIADWLTGEHDLSRWWAQKLIVEYEHARGLRPAGVRPGGTFSVTASKTVDVPVERLFDAFTNDQAAQALAPRREYARAYLPAWPLGAVRLGGWT